MQAAQAHGLGPEDFCMSANTTGATATAPVISGLRYHPPSQAGFHFLSCNAPMAVMCGGSTGGSIEQALRAKEPMRKGNCLLRTQLSLGSRGLMCGDYNFINGLAGWTGSLGFVPPFSVLVSNSLCQFMP